MRAAWTFAGAERARSPIMVEENFACSHLRVFVLGRKVVCTYLKIPPNVIGDGTLTVVELVAAKNHDRRKSPALRVAMIKTDA